jgi:hypothetical protein
MPSPDVLIRVQQDLSKRDKIVALLEGELNFHGRDSGYASHSLHAFAAKFPPQLPRAFIRGLTSRGEVVLDPMVGSGTTVVEALLEGRRGIGIDIDPLALCLSCVKTTPLNFVSLQEVGYRVISRAHTFLSDGEAIDQALAGWFDEPTKKFVDYWFLETTQRELMALMLAIKDVPNTAARRFLELAFSSIIVTKSGGVSRARDLAHSRAHLDKEKIPKNALDQFSRRLRKNLISIAQIESDDTTADTMASDAHDAI